MIDLNSGSGFVYGGQTPSGTTSQRVNALIDSALVEQNRQQRPRDYLGGSRIGEPCARKLVYEINHTPIDAGKGFNASVTVLRSLNICSGLRPSKPGPPSGKPASLFIRMDIWLAPFAP